MEIVLINGDHFRVYYTWNFSQGRVLGRAVTTEFRIKFVLLDDIFSKLLLFKSGKQIRNL